MTFWRHVDATSLSDHTLLIFCLEITLPEWLLLTIYERGDWDNFRELTEIETVPPATVSAAWVKSEANDLVSNMREAVLQACPLFPVHISKK